MSAPLDSTDSWADLSAEARRAAIDFAARGEAHPDPAVAAIVVRRVRQLNRTDRAVARMLVNLAAGVWFGTMLAVLYAGGEVVDGPWWLAATIVPVGLVIFMFHIRNVPIVPRGGLPAYAEPPNLRYVLAETPTPAPQRLTIESSRGRDLWRLAVVVPLAAGSSWLIWVNLDLPMRLVQGLTKIAGILVTLGLARLVLSLVGAIVRRVRGRGASPEPVAEPPISMGPGGLTFHGLADSIRWADVHDVELIGPTPEEPGVSLAVRWTFRTRAPITIPATDMAEPPEVAILTTRALFSAAQSQSTPA